jgi:hypothetical protein
MFTPLETFALTVGLIMLAAAPAVAASTRDWKRSALRWRVAERPLVKGCRSKRHPGIGRRKCVNADALIQKRRQTDEPAARAIRIELPSKVMLR